ncbi:hypothetical protein [Burkholderia gladioli]|uniref:hypothetical protein n=1 Tax=Burkholderia gladioli TaxID=28095 RepID=UPI001641515A|nr:hypothetical protein [Burkholderia gladioli]
MENVSSNEALPPAGNKGWVKRITSMNRLFALTVVAPTAIALIYFGAIASDVYVSESRFVVRSTQRQPQMSVVGALLQGSGFSRSQDDAYSVVDYIQSRDALRELNQGDYIANAYSEHGDFVGRFHKSLDDSFEALWKYYRNKVIAVDLDTTSSIITLQTRAYSAKDAERINASLIGVSEQLVNRMNDRAAADTVEFAQKQVDAAAERAKNAAVALAAYRNSYTVFDPEKQSALQLQQVNNLQSQMMTAQQQLIQLQSVAPANPQVATLKTTIETLKQQIATATGGVAGGRGSLSDKAAKYARLQLDAQFADKQLASAMASMENAREDLQRKQLYLERLVQPNTPDVAIEPRRGKAILETLILSLVVWGVLSLLLAGVREHYD